MYDDIKVRDARECPAETTKEPRDHVKLLGIPLLPGGIPLWDSGTEMRIKVFTSFVLAN